MNARPAVQASLVEADVPSKWLYHGVVGDEAKRPSDGRSGTSKRRWAGISWPRACEAPSLKSPECSAERGRSISAREETGTDTSTC